MVHEASSSSRQFSTERSMRCIWHLYRHPGNQVRGVCRCAGPVVLRTYTPGEMRTWFRVGGIGTGLDFPRCSVLAVSSVRNGHPWDPVLPGQLLHPASFFLPFVPILIDFILLRVEGVWVGLVARVFWW